MKKTYESIKKVFESKLLTKIFYALGIAIAVMLIFSVGLSVGSRKSSFNRAWGENYERNFGKMSGRLPLFSGNNLPNAHGAIGKIIKIELPALIVEDRDGTEKALTLKDDATVHKMRESIAIADLKVGDFIVVIGSPNELGQIETSFVRVIPEPDLMFGGRGGGMKNAPDGKFK